jgi:hypothetical protein
MAERDTRREPRAAEKKESSVRITELPSALVYRTKRALGFKDAEKDDKSKHQH